MKSMNYKCTGEDKFVSEDSQQGRIKADPQKTRKLKQ